MYVLLTCWYLYIPNALTALSMAVTTWFIRVKVAWAELSSVTMSVSDGSTLQTITVMKGIGLPRNLPSSTSDKRACNVLGISVPSNASLVVMRSLSCLESTKRRRADSNRLRTRNAKAVDTLIKNAMKGISVTKRPMKTAAMGRRRVWPSTKKFTNVGCGWVTRGRQMNNVRMSIEDPVTVCEEHVDKRGSPRSAQHRSDSDASVLLHERSGITLPGWYTILYSRVGHWVSAARMRSQMYVSKTKSTIEHVWKAVHIAEW
mmetsp:Transcript_17317/g.41739  ORF Transcript_17317/g.41739 Transcript_17317/m.41739 type:complete len:260 (-) Transcript_17317:366-1145(-)